MRGLSDLRVGWLGRLRRAVHWALLIGACAGLLSCQDSSVPQRPKPKPDPYTIRFVTINSPNTYYVDSQNSYAGLEYDLAKAFVEFLGPAYKLEFIVVDNFSRVLPTLIEGDADIAAADISITDTRRRKVRFGPPFHQVQSYVVYNKDILPKPTGLADIFNKVMVLPKGTSFGERLRQLRSKHPELRWQESDKHNSEQLLEAVANQEIDYTIADNHLLAIMSYNYPQLGSGMPFGPPDQIAWAMGKKTPPERLKQIEMFFKQIEKNGLLRNLIDRYHGYTQRLNTIDVATFLGRTQTLLPQYIRVFKGAQEITDIDWRLLAALSYQESHWDNYSTSPTNVRGLMMLTEQTSNMLNVSDRLDPRQSVTAGAKYLLLLKDRIPERIPEPDRTFMALAAYNSGIAHIEDARVVAQRMRLNPDSWADVKKGLLKLNDPSFYVNAKHGYCSCGAAIIYTEAVRSYYQIMQKHFPAYDPAIDPYKIALFDKAS